MNVSARNVTFDGHPPGPALTELLGGFYEGALDAAGHEVALLTNGDGFRVVRS